MSNRETMQQRIVKAIDEVEECAYEFAESSMSLGHDLAGAIERARADENRDELRAAISRLRILFEHFAPAPFGVPASGVDVILHCHMGELWASEQEFNAMNDEDVIELAEEDVAELFCDAKWEIVRASRESAAESAWTWKNRGNGRCDSCHAEGNLWFLSDGVMNYSSLGLCYDCKETADQHSRKSAAGPKRGAL